MTNKVTGSWLKESDLEKTEQPSLQRLEKAREEGQVARSRELTQPGRIADIGFTQVMFNRRYKPVQAAFEEVVTRASLNGADNIFFTQIV
ncbi:MAG: EscU/YscU/HrcU family type III secretion system export apparatus switch protein [Gallionellaceae bacterium]